MSKYIPVDPEKWAEMVKAMAENRLLKAEVQHWQEQWHFVIQDNNKQMDENARLKAEVERLTNCKAEADRLKAEVERLNDAIMRGASIPDAKPTDE